MIKSILKPFIAIKNFLFVENFKTDKFSFIYAKWIGITLYNARHHISKIKKIARKHYITSSLLIFFLVLVVAYKIYERKYYEGILPSQIKIAKTFVIDGSGCGVASFWLDDKTLDEIKNKGLSFFDDATKGRNPERRIFYKKWQITPMPPENFSEGWWAGFGCAKTLSNQWKHKIFEAAQVRGGYYTFDGRGSDLLVLPELKIVIFIYID